MPGHGTARTGRNRTVTWVRNSSVSYIISPEIYAHFKYKTDVAFGGVTNCAKKLKQYNLSTKCLLKLRLPTQHKYVVRNEVFPVGVSPEDGLIVHLAVGHDNASTAYEVVTVGRHAAALWMELKVHCNARASSAPSRHAPDCPAV